MEDIAVGPIAAHQTPEIPRTEPENETRSVVFETKVIGEKSLDALVALKQQLHDPQSLLMQGRTAANKVTSVTILLKCPVGAIKAVGDSACFQCTDHKYTPDGITCFSCAAGTGPTPDRGGCQICPGVAFSLAGVCQKCPAGTMGARDRTRCIDIRDSGPIEDVSVTLQILSDTNVLPAVTIEIEIAPDSVKEGSVKRASLVQMLVEDTAASLGFNTSDVTVADLWIARRRLQALPSMTQTHIAAKVSFVFDVPNRSTTVNRLLVQLHDPSSSMRTDFRAGTINAGVPPTFEFVCPVNMHRPDGFHDCLPCDGGSVPNPDDNFKSCKDCAEREAPDQTTGFASCGCAKGFYDSSLRLKCHSVDFSSAAKLSTKCQQCGDLECIEDCHGQQLTVAPGWSLVANLDGSASVFRCKYEDACPGGTVFRNSTGCTRGYTSLLCGVCSPNFAVRSGGECTDCEELSWAGVLLILVCVVIIILLAFNVRVWYNYFTILKDSVQLIQAMELKAIGKILLTTMQLIGGFSRVLNVYLPRLFEGLLDFLSMFDFDLAIGLGCFTPMEYVPNLVATFAIVAVVVAVNECVYLRQIHAVDKDPGKIPEDKRRERAQAMFDKFDLDGDGIELHELALIVDKIDPSVGRETVESLFKQADSDGGVQSNCFLTE
jgi:hypothetical protein